MDKYENDVHNCTNPRLADMLEEIADGAEKAFGQIDNEEVLEIAKHENTILRESAKRLRIPPHPTFHEEYMGGMLMSPFATYIKAVDVLTDKGWKTFESIKDAASFIGCAHGTLSAKLIRDLPCKGYQVRYHE